MNAIPVNISYKEAKMHTKHWKFFAIALFILGTSATSWASAPVVEWSRTFGGSGDDWANAIQQTSDGGYIVVGSTNSNDGDVAGIRGWFASGRDAWVIRLDANGDIVWQRTLGGSGGDSVRAVQQTTDGGFIVAGHYESSGGFFSGNQNNPNGWVVKFDADGRVEWQRSYGGREIDFINDIQQTSDEGFIFIGTTSSIRELEDGRPNIFVRFTTWLFGLDQSARFFRGNDAWVARLNSSGAIEWQKVLGGPGLRQNTGRAIQQTADGGYIAAAQASNFRNDILSLDAWIIRLDATGDIVWQRLLGGSGTDFVSSIKQTADGGYIVVGNSDSNDDDASSNHEYPNGWVIKLDNNGEIEWQRLLGGSGRDIFNSIQQTMDGGYIIAGRSNSNDGDVSSNRGSLNGWIVKLDNNGEIEWQKTLGGSGVDVFDSVQQTADGGYILAGSSTSSDGDVLRNNGESDFWIVKLKYESTARQ